MIWAGNSGTPQGNTNGTCGSGTPSNTLSGASYSNSYVYTQLGQLWQGPYNGSGSYQYLYCNSSQPHQLTGLYPTGTTCSTTSGQTQTYAATYNSWGDMKTRTATGTGATTASLNYDAQDHLVRWQDNNTSSNEESYLYDSSGQRILRRSQTGSGNSGTKYTITVFGLEDHIYDGGGSSLNNKYYYSLVGHMIGVLNNSGTSFLFTDALGSVVSTISNTANSASVGGNQVYGPFGSNPYSKGTMGTTKGYTGQYNDSLTQLDYYGARYYDPFTGVFLSADEVQGNFAGMNPYNYVGDNPETNIDPNGEMYAPPPGSQPQGTPPPIGGGLGTGSSTSTSTSTGGTSSGNGFGFIIEGLEQAVQDVVKSLPANIPEDIATFGEDALVGAEDAVCPECLLIPLIVMLVNPTPLASGTLPPGQSLTLPRQNSGPQNTGPQTQTGGGHGGLRPPGSGQPPTAPPPEEPRPTKAPKDLYRNGNTESPRATHVRINKDVFPDENNMICSGEGGISTSERITKPGKWWKLPAGTQLPEGLQFWNNHGDHWFIEPAGNMTVDEFIELLGSIQGWEKCF